MTSKPLTSSLVAAAQAWQDTKSDDDRRQLIAAANKVVEHLETPAETLARIGWGLLEKLSDLPQTSQTLAEGTPADPALVGRILKHLTACSLVNETGADLYVATDLTRSLDDPTLGGGYIYSFDGMIPTFHRLPSFLAKINYQVPSDNANGPPESARSARAYYLHLVLHDWDDENCRKILGNVRDAMESGYSKLLINENVMEDVGAPWQQTSLDWTMMAMLVNRERTKSQWTALLDSVGLRIEGIWSKDLTSESVTEAVLA
ncbi:hypothetical protein E8E11_008681 [Didymella keratinophila]|nr:hypothetical protein E8E11_008681 [Didymella keratinophila]